MHFILIISIFDNIKKEEDEKKHIYMYVIMGNGYRTWFLALNFEIRSLFFLSLSLTLACLLA